MSNLLKTDGTDKNVDLHKVRHEIFHTVYCLEESVKYHANHLISEDELVDFVRSGANKLKDIHRYLESFKEEK